MNLLPAVPLENRTTVLWNPFSMARDEIITPMGLTVQEIVFGVLGIRSTAAVLVDGRPVDRERWGQVIPAPGSHLIVRVVPMKGGDDGGKDPLTAVLSIAVAIAAPYIGSWLGPSLAGAMGITSTLGVQLVTGLVTGATLAIGKMAISALAPAPNQQSLSYRGAGIARSPGLSARGAGGSRSDIERSPSLTGGNNYNNRYGPLPKIFGTHRVVPPYGADPYTEISGDDQYLRMLFIIGYGPLSISSLKIGETDLDDFSGVEYEIREGYDDDEDLTLYTNDIDELSLNIHLTSAGGWHTRTTETACDEISFDITFPNGLIQFTENRAENQTQYVNQQTGEVTTEGELLPPETAVSVRVDYEYSVAGADTWTAGSVTTTAKRGKTIRKNVRVPVTNGQYDVRLKRISADTDSSYILDDVYWTALRTVRCSDPVNFTVPVAKIAMRIKASDQLQGVVDTFSCVASAVLNDYDGGAWTEQETKNPAAAFRDVLQGDANKRALSDGEVDLEDLAEWSEFCDTNGFTYNQVIDFQSSVEDILQEVASAGRAAPAYKDGKFTVVWDRAQTTPVQHFTPRNSWGFSSEKIFTRLPHAWRVRFPNEDAGYQEDERIVYDDGYDATNATRFEQLQLPGVTESDLAWKHGRYHLATVRLRPEIYSWYADVEHIVCTRGDLVRVSHDVPLWGLSTGRVKTVTDDGTNVTSVTLDEQCTMTAAGSYTARFRKKTGSTLLVNLTTVAGTDTEIFFSDTVAVADGPEAGDLCMFGESGTESVQLLIRSIETDSDLNARITAVDYSPAVYTADTGTIPEFTSYITHPRDTLYTVGTPIIEQIVSDESVLERSTDGTYLPRISISFKYRTGALMDQVVETQVDYRIHGTEEAWTRKTTANFVQEMILENVTEGETYDLRFRYKTAADRVSGWTTTYEHTVVGRSTPPPDVPRLFSDRTYLRWDYGAPPIDFAGFRVKYRPGVFRNWSDAMSAHGELVKTTSFPLSEIPEGLGVTTVMVKAEDVAGNQSTNPAVIVMNLGDATTENVVETYDLAAAGFPGTIVNGAVDGTDLEADEESATFWKASEGAPFWDTDETAVFWDSHYLQMQYFVGRAQANKFWDDDAETFWAGDASLFWYSEVSYSTGYTPDAQYLPAVMRLDYDITGDPWYIYYRTGGSAAFWPGAAGEEFWDDDTELFWGADGEDTWQPWPGSIEATRQNYEFWVVTGASSAIQGVIRDFKILLDMPDVEEWIDDASIASGGARLTLANTYTAISNVNLTLQDDGGSAVYAIVSDKSTSGPMIKCYDKNGNAAAGTVDAFVQGY